MSQLRGFDKRTELISDFLVGYMAAIRSLRKH